MQPSSPMTSRLLTVPCGETGLRVLRSVALRGAAKQITSHCMPTISEAVAYHEAGQLQRAEQVYRQILHADPNQADAWHLLGLLAHQVGQHRLALEYIGRAITLSNRVA